MEDIQQRKLLSALSHGAIFFGSTIVSIGIPIVILIISNDPIIKQNAKQSFNFHINFYIIYAITFILLYIVRIEILFFLLIVLGMVSFIMPIIAIINVLSQPNVSYRYPLIFQFM